MRIGKFSSISTIGIILSGCIISSCEKKNENTMREPARDLYLKSVSLAERYIDSIGHAKDSTLLLSMIERYDNEVTNLNYSYPPGADYELAEGENDTLKNLSARIILLRDSLLYVYAYPLPKDSLLTDYNKE